MDLALKKWPVSGDYDKGALRKTLVSGLAEVLPFTSPSEFGRLAVDLPGRLFSQGLVLLSGTTEALFTLIFSERSSGALLVRHQPDRTSYAVRQITLCLKPLLTGLDAPSYVTAFALLCGLVEKGQKNTGGAAALSPHP